MILYCLGIAALTAFELWHMRKKKYWREMWVFSALALLTLAFGLYYIAQPFAPSLAQRLHDLLGIK